MKDVSRLAEEDINRRLKITEKKFTIIYIIKKHDRQTKRVARRVP